ncbi:MAG: isocitrate lyase/PEP mutase family protein [Candidatus Dormibacteria bacterium]
MTTQVERAARFLDLHHAQGGPLLMPNPWDRGSAKLLESLGFSALATTSSGFAASLGRRDYRVTRAEALAHSAAIVATTDLPVSADLENGFADQPAGVAETISMAIAAGLAGASIEDFTGRPDDPIYDHVLATERVAAAAAAAHSGPVHLVLTARAENLLHGRSDLSDTIARLRAYGAAGADVVFAPGLASVDEVRQLVTAVDLPVSVLLLPGGPTVPELSAAGVRRVSVGGAFAFVALGALAEAAQELLDTGTLGFFEHGGRGFRAARAAFKD